MTPPEKPTVALRSPRFLSYLLAQVLGVFNDSAFKVGVLFFALESVADPSVRIAYSSLITAIFALPWLLFSPLAGYLADRFRKDRVLLATKLPELGLMVLGVIGFRQHSVALLCSVFFLLSVQSTFFSPAKYGLLPEIFADEELVSANGIVGMTTMVAVLLGTAFGVPLSGGGGWAYVIVAVLGTLAAAYVPRTSPGNPAAVLPADPIRQSLVDLRGVQAVPALGSTVLGISFFTFVGSLLLTIVPVYCTDVLALGTKESSRVLASLTVGVAAGSLGAGWLSRGRVEIGLVPLGALLMTLASFDVAVFRTRGALALWGVPLRALLDFALIGVGGGLFNVPLQAALQRRSPEGQKGQVIAFSNVASNLMIMAAAVFPVLLTALTTWFALGSGPVVALMLFLHAIILIGTVYIALRLPDYTARFAVYLLVSALYRMRIHGTHHIPPRGALLVANHVSWLDALVVTAASGRMVRFLMYRPYYEARPLHWLFKRLHVIPVAGGDDPERTAEALERAREEIRAGHVVCIFAEGAITRTGQLLEFRRGLERIAAGLEAPIVPVYLHGLWGSLFSFKGGRVLLKWPRGFRHRIQVLFGPPLPSASPAFEVRQAVQNLSVDALEFDREGMGTLGVELLRAARRFWRRPFVADAQLGPLRCSEALAAALALRERAFARAPADERCVGVLLPPGLAGVLANLAVLFAGRVPVNLPTESAERALRAIRAAGIRRVLGSPALWKELALGAADEPRVEFVAVEPDAASLARDRRWPALRGLAARWLPHAVAARVFLRGDHGDPDAAAAVLFSRGLTGAPKAIVLSHRNLLSNLIALREVFTVSSEDGIVSSAPLWHSLGFVSGLCLPLFAGARAGHHSDAFDASGVIAAVRAARATVLLATPPALQLYAQSVAPADFASLTRVVTGGAPLPAEVRARFAERFGVEPLEGYGSAECSPFISLNVPDFELAPGRLQPGTRPGTHGHPLPGVAVQIVDPATGAALAPETPGRIRVRGPNVLRGYLEEDGRERRATSADGWYDTADLGVLDRAGFLTVLGRVDASGAEGDPGRI